MPARWTTARSTSHPTSLVFTSEPMDESVEITGWPQVVLHASTDATDMDLMAEMHVVDADGASRIVNEGIVRARYRTSRSAPQAVRARCGGGVRGQAAPERPTAAPGTSVCGC